VQAHQVGDVVVVFDDQDVAVHGSGLTWQWKHTEQPSRNNHALESPGEHRGAGTAAIGEPERAGRSTPFPESQGVTRSSIVGGCPPR
jgi:hypothetical protein